MGAQAVTVDEAEDALGGEVRTCLDCGEDISDRHGKARLCVACALARDNVHKRAWWSANRDKERDGKRRLKDANPELFLANSRRRQRRWRESNPDKLRARAKDRWAKEGKQHQAKVEQWRRENKDRVRETTKRWQKSHPEKMRVAKRAGHLRRRAKKLNQLGSVSLNIEQALMRRQRDRCAGCRKALGFRWTWHLDHIMPLALGGLHDDSNLQILCVACNLSKGAQHPLRWQKSLRPPVERLDEQRR